MASVPGVTWEEFMRWLSRRLVLKQGFAATLVPVLGLDAVTRHPIERPLILAAPSCALWANPIYEAVLSPTDAARRAALELEMSSADSIDSLRSLRQAAAAVMRAELSSDYTQLAQSLPGLIGRIELVNLRASDDDRLNKQRLLSEVYAVA